MLPVRAVAAPPAPPLPLPVLRRSAARGRWSWYLVRTVAALEVRPSLLVLYLWSSFRPVDRSLLPLGLSTFLTAHNEWDPYDHQLPNSSDAIWRLGTVP